MPTVYQVLTLSLLIALVALGIRHHKLQTENTHLLLFSQQTSLPNSSSLYHDGQKLLSACPSAEIVLLYIDIDNFRYINETISHNLGNQILSEVSRRLVSLSQPKGQVYHLGEDGFAILFRKMGEKGMGEVMAAHILAGFKTAFTVEEQILYLTVSIGVVEHPEANEDFTQLLNAAEVAMYEAKQTGKSRYVVFNNALKNQLVEQINIQKHLRAAIEEGEFKIFYQPQVNLTTYRVDGFEALLRWNSKALGVVSPDKFISVAELTNLIIPLGNWVLRTACAYLKKLETLGWPSLGMSVNISIKQLLQNDFFTIVEDTLEFLDLAPERLELEITESLLMETFQEVLPRLKRLRELGVRIALDDFGTGYSSISYLSQIPITTLKLDKTYTDKIGGKQEGLIESILYLCKRLDLHTVAEGVEDKVQVAYLRQMGCHKIQGYVYSKALPENEIVDLLTSKESMNVMDE